jgi:ACR3 family arsenite efflux pump ArsB
MFMIAAVALIIVTIILVGWPSSMYLMSRAGQFRFRLTPERQAMIAASFTAAAAICMAIWWFAMKSGVRALEEMRK